MEMLQAKQEQEKKRLREQMEAEAAVQRQQMENMVKARVMEVKKTPTKFHARKPDTQSTTCTNAKIK